jgi:hypothetical protein
MVFSEARHGRSILSVTTAAFMHLCLAWTAAVRSSTWASDLGLTKRTGGGETGLG